MRLKLINLEFEDARQWYHFIVGGITEISTA